MPLQKILSSIKTNKITHVDLSKEFIYEENPKPFLQLSKHVSVVRNLEINTDGNLVTLETKLYQDKRSEAALSIIWDIKKGIKVTEATTSSGELTTTLGGRVQRIYERRYYEIQSHENWHNSTNPDSPIPAYHIGVIKHDGTPEPLIGNVDWVFTYEYKIDGPANMHRIRYVARIISSHYLLASDINGYLTKWTEEKEDWSFKPTGGQVFALEEFDHERVFTGSEDGIIRVFNHKSQTFEFMFNGQHKGPVLALAKHPALQSNLGDAYGKKGYLISGSADQTIKFWDTSNGTCLATFVGHSSAICALKSISGNQFASSSKGRRTKIWDIRPKSSLFKLFKTLYKNTSVKHLTLHNAPLKDDDIPVLAALLKKNTTIKVLDVSYTNITNSAVASFLDFIKTRTMGLEVIHDCQRLRSYHKPPEIKESKAPIYAPPISYPPTLSLPSLDIRSTPSVDATLPSSMPARDLKDLDQRLAVVEAKTQNLDPAILAKFKAIESTLDRIIETALEEKASDAKHQRILAEEHLKAYYCMFVILLEGSWRACENIYSGFAAQAKKGKADRLTQALDEAGKLIPGLGIPLKLISAVIKAVELPNKHKAVHNLAFFFSLEKLPGLIIRNLARKVAIDQDSTLRDIYNSSPSGFKDKVTQRYRELKDWILADEGHNPVMAKARADIERLVLAIIKGELMPPVDPDKMRRCVLGQSFVIRAPAETATTLFASISTRSELSSSSSSSQISEGKEEKKEVTLSDSKRTDPPTSLDTYSELPALAISTDSTTSAPREAKEDKSGGPTTAELLTMFRALEEKHLATQTALERSERELAKLKNDLESPDISVPGRGGQLQMLVSVPSARRPGGYNPRFQAEDEERRKTAERALAMHQDCLDQHDARLSVQAEQLSKLSKQNSKCTIL